MRISTGRRCITPSGPYFPCYLLGHAIRVDKALGVYDELWCTAYRVIVDEETMIWVSLELGNYNKSQSDEIRDYLSKEYDVKKDLINISFVHTHSGPESDYFSPFGATERAAIKGYPEYITQKIKEAVADAFAAEAVEVKAYLKYVDIVGFYGNRNSKDASADKRMLTINFYDGERLVATILNMTCHPTVLGPQNLYVSGDLAGYICSGIQKRTGVYPLFMQGAAGDISNRLYRQGNDYNELKRIGEGILAQWDAKEMKEEILIKDLKWQNYHFKETYYPDLEIKRQRVRDIEEKIKRAKDFDEKKVYSSSLAVAKFNVDVAEYTLDIECTLLKMNDLFILIIPAELFNSFGQEIKKAMGVKCPLIWGYSNYSVGYLVDSEEYGRSFESACSDIPKGTTERIVEGIIMMIKEMEGIQ